MHEEAIMRTSLLTAVAVAVVLLAGNTVQAQAGFCEARARVILNEAINTGAPIFNRGDACGCYLVYRGALSSVLPLLRNRPDLQIHIRAALRRAACQRCSDARAWTLRRAIDRTLEALN